MGSVVFKGLRLDRLGVMGGSPALPPVNAAPVNVSLPTVSGTPEVGETPTGGPGAWTGYPYPTFAYQWQRGVTDIIGATSSTYTAVSADAGSTLRLKVTASNGEGPPVIAYSLPTATIKAVIDVSTNPTAAGIGTVYEGETYSEVLARIDEGTATTNGPGSVTATASLTNSGTDPFTAGDVISNIRVEYSATHADPETRDIPVSITVEAAADVVAPVVSSVSVTGDTISMDVVDASGLVSLRIATADPVDDPTYTTGGGWSGTTYETFFIPGVTTGTIAEEFTITALTPSGNREITIYSVDPAGLVSTVSRVAYRVDHGDLAPALTLPTGAKNGSDGATSLGVTSDEGAGTLYLGIYPSASTPEAEDVVAGTGAPVATSKTVTATGAQTFADQTGLAGSTAYKAHYVHVDTDANLSNISTTTEFTTDVAASAPAIPGVPTITGTPTVGEILTATASTPVTGVPTPTRTWQWVNSVSGDISGAEASTYTLVAADQGDTITVRQIETNTEDNDTATSAATDAIASASATRRKLISTSTVAGTGMHSTADVTLTADEFTIAFWYLHKAGNVNKTLWASDTGQYQIYIEDSGGDVMVARRYLNDAAKTTTVLTVDQWYHIHVKIGLDFDATTDVQVYVDGLLEASNSVGNSGGEIDSAGTHWLLGDDSTTTNTDAGYAAEIFDFAMFDGIVLIGDSNRSGTSWADFSAGALAKLLYRIDGQNVSDPGEDSSSNGHDFTIEGGGVTLSDIGLPAGANT